MESTVHLFLGGTCNESEWREKLIKMLPEGVTYFNPVVPNWTEARKAIEIEERDKADVVLYTITPKMTGVYSIAEVVDDSNKKPEATVLCLLTIDKEDGEQIKFDKTELKSLKSVMEMIITNGGHVFTKLKDVADHCEAMLVFKQLASNSANESMIPDKLFGYKI